MSDSNPSAEVLSATHVMEYPYRRSLGPVLSEFFTGLRDRRIVGNKTASGRVLVPPSEYDPESGDETGDFVDVGPEGTVKSWAWVGEPRRQHPRDRPFAFALIQLDGANTALLHVVDTHDEASISTGMRVTARWADEPSGGILDLAGFVPVGGEDGKDAS